MIISLFDEVLYIMTWNHGVKILLDYEFTLYFKVSLLPCLYIRIE